MKVDNKTVAPVITPLGFTDEDLLTLQNGVILEVKRTASAGQVAMLEHALSLYHRLESPTDAAIARLKKLNQDAQQQAAAEAAVEASKQIAEENK